MTDDEEERTAETRQLAERALIKLLTGGSPTTEHLIVLGGLIPPTLTGASADVPAHMGTTDVDVLLVTHLTVERDLADVERALTDMEFEPDPDGWRWRGRIDGRVVKIEFLCDLETARAEELIGPKGCTRLRAVNLRVTGAVEHGYRQWSLDGPDGPVPVKYAGLGGYVLAKVASARHRAADKDYYDLAYVLLFNDQGGAAGAVAAIKANDALRARAEAMRSDLLEVKFRFDSDRAVGAKAYASESLKVTPEEDGALLAADATAAVSDFIAALGL